MKTRLPAWTKTTLLLAGIYNLIWGAWVVLFPATAFEWLHVEPPKYLELWQCIGMIVGCYGIGYLIASTNPARYWPITLVGLIGKVAGPVGFIQALWTGVFPLSFGWLIVFNDLIWWIPFTAMLWLVFQDYRKPAFKQSTTERLRLMTAYRSSKGRAVNLQKDQQALLIFLRHSGCTFCREMLSDLNRDFPKIRSTGMRVVLVHMSSIDDMNQVLDTLGLAEIEHISDPQCELYRAYGLQKGSFGQLFGTEVWKRGWQAGVSQRHGVGWLDGDGFQMPGVFGLQQGQVITSFIHQHAGDRPDYIKMTQELRLVGDQVLTV